MDKGNFVTYEPITSIVPKDWAEWFYECLSENAPFSWGDNNLTLVFAYRVLDHCRNVLDHVVEDGLATEEELQEFFQKLENMGDEFVALDV